MPEKNRIQKRIAEYKKFAGKFRKVSANDTLAKEKKKVNTSFAALAALMEQLDNESKANPAKKLSPDMLTQLDKLYGESLKSVSGLLKTAGENYGTLIRKKNLSPAENEEIISLRQTVNQYDYIKRKLSKDARTVAAAKKNKKAISMKALYEKSKINNSYGVKYADGTNEAGGQHSRMKLVLVNPAKQLVEGYFTPDSTMSGGSIEEANKVFNETKKKYGKKADFLTEELFKNYIRFIYNNNRGLTEDLTGNTMGKYAEMGYEKAVEVFNRRVDPDEEGQFLFENICRNEEQYHIFLDVANKYLGVLNVFGISGTAGISMKERNNRRNTAMSMMADMIGCPEAVAKSEDIKITIGGKKIKGTFMQKAKGSDIKKIGKDSDLLKVTPLSFENLELKKSVCDLQILDYICGNTDRSYTNLSYITKEVNGKVQVVGVQGFDNDTSIGDMDSENPNVTAVLLLKDIKVIRKERAEWIMNLNEDKIRQMFYGQDITTTQMDNMLYRIKVLQDKISDGRDFYANKSKGILDRSHLRTVDDKELDLLSVKNDLAVGTSLFASVVKHTGNKNLEDAEINSSEKVQASVRRIAYDSFAELDKILKNIESVDKKYQTGSPQYTEMRNKTRLLHEAIGGFGKKAYVFEDGVKKISADMKNIKKLIDDVDEAINDYRRYKINRNIIENKHNDDFTPHKLSRRELRWNYTEDNRIFISGLKREYEKMEQSLKEYNEFMAEKNRLKDEYNALEKSEKNEYSNLLKAKSDLIDYNDLFARTEDAVITDFMKWEKAKKEKKDKDATAAKMNLDIKLGFAVIGFPKKDADKLVDELGFFMGNKISESKEELFRRAVATQLIKAKKDAQNKGDKAGKYDKMVLDALKNVKVDGNDAVDNFMKTPELKDFANYYIRPFDINNAYNATIKSMNPDKKAHIGLRRALHSAGIEKDVALTASFNPVSMAVAFDKLNKLPVNDNSKKNIQRKI